jgi:photosystem II stability/assembly factor-like uncharacterized protein
MLQPTFLSRGRYLCLLLLVCLAGCAPETTSFFPIPTIAPLDPGQPLLLNPLRMTDANNGWAVELWGRLMRTRDGGRTWKNVTPPEMERFNFYNEGRFFFLDANIAWVTQTSFCNVGESRSCEDPVRTATVWRTVDGGQTWRESQPISLGLSSDQDRAYIPTLYFLDDQNGWLAAELAETPEGHAYQELFVTKDGGATWKIIIDELHFPWPGFTQNLVFSDVQTGWAVEYGGTHLLLHRTNDGGRTWDSEGGQTCAPPQPSDGSEKAELFWNVEPAYRTSQALGVGISCREADNTFYYLTSDGGQTWNSWPATGSEHFVNAATGWRLFSPADRDQPGQLQRTSDGGQTWITIRSVPWELAYFNFVNEQVGWVMVRTGDTSPLLHTTDGGQTWTEIKPVVADR